MSTSSAKVTIYHNPRCTKSRQTLQLLQDEGHEPKVVEYLKEPLDEAAIRGLLKKLGLTAAELIRKNDYRKLDLPVTDDEGELIALMAEHPKIIERPIVVSGRQARLGRPPENVLKIL